jgi:hypothetical protein
MQSGKGTAFSKDATNEENIIPPSLWAVRYAANFCPTYDKDVRDPPAIAIIPVHARPIIAAVVPIGNPFTPLLAKSLNLFTSTSEVINDPAGPGRKVNTVIS